METFRFALAVRSVVAAFAFVALAANAEAQPASAKAEVLFREGKRLIGEGNITAALGLIRSRGRFSYAAMSRDWSAARSNCAGVA